MNSTRKKNKTKKTSAHTIETKGWQRRLNSCTASIIFAWTIFSTQPIHIIYFVCVSSGVGIYVIGCFSLLLNNFFLFSLHSHERAKRNAGVETQCSSFVSKYVPLCVRNLADFNYNLAAIFLRCKNSNHDHYHIKMAINVCKTTPSKKKAGQSLYCVFTS